MIALQVSIPTIHRVLEGACVARMVYREPTSSASCVVHTQLLGDISRRDAYRERCHRTFGSRRVINAVLAACVPSENPVIAVGKCKLRVSRMDGEETQDTGEINKLASSPQPTPCHTTTPSIISGLAPRNTCLVRGNTSAWSDFIEVVDVKGTAPRMFRPRTAEIDDRSINRSRLKT